MAFGQLYINKPFSNLAELSDRKPNFFAVWRTDVPSKTADSKITFLVPAVISDSNPPITPAIAKTFFSSAITSIESSNSRNTPSKVTNSSPT